MKSSENNIYKRCRQLNLEYAAGYAVSKCLADRLAKHAPVYWTQTHTCISSLASGASLAALW